MDLDLIIPMKERHRLLGAIASLPREKILKLVCERERNIRELAREIGFSPMTVIGHVDMLEKAKLVKTRIDKRAQGKPRMIAPTKRIFDEGLNIYLSPIFKQIPIYRKARELINAYREEASTASSENPYIRDSPVAIPEYDFKYNPITGRGPPIQKRRQIGATPWGPHVTWITQVVSVLFRCVKILAFHNKKVLIREVSCVPPAWGLSRWASQFEPPSLDFSHVGIERELRESKTPLAKVALEILEEIRTRIPKLLGTTPLAIYRTYLECLKALEKTAARIPAKKEKCRRIVTGPLRGGTYQRTVDCLDDLESLEKEINRCFVLIGNVEKEVRGFALLDHEEKKEEVK